MATTAGLPFFLESFENLTAHFDEHFGDLGSNERGDTFLGLAQKLTPLIEECQNFPQPQLREKKSHDGGVDLLTAETEDGRILCIQSKYKLRDKDSLDSIISKFKDFAENLRPAPRTPDLFDGGVDDSIPVPTFAIITSSKLEGILKRYEASTLASREYFERLRAERRLLIIDGPRLLSQLQHLYKKAHLLPANISLSSVCSWIKVGGVYLGAVAGRELVALYTEHGDALFFENIRDFLGASSGKAVTTRETVNQEIIQTIRTEPAKMLARNNGVTLRALKASVDDEPQTLTLAGAAIVNGCQTTMCLVHCEEVPADCFVQVKVVETDDAWDIAKAANYQNPVARVDLDLARYLRPQLVRKVATSLGYAIEVESTVTASSVLNTIYRNKVNYEELRLLYLGLFSRKPNNLFDGNYTELRPDILEGIYEQAEGEERVFAVLLLLLTESRRALDECRLAFSADEYAHLFNRFFQDDRPRYRAYLSLVALAAILREDISQKSPIKVDEVARLRRFLGRARELLENEADRFRNVFIMTFQSIAESLLDVGDKTDAEIAQQMSSKVERAAFSHVFKRILLRIDGERRRLEGLTQT